MEFSSITSTAGNSDLKYHFHSNILVTFGELSKSQLLIMRLIISWLGQEVALFLIRVLAITDTRCYFSIAILSWHVILSNHDNTKLWQQL